jgi:hypothetical protein
MIHRAVLHRRQQALTRIHVFVPCFFNRKEAKTAKKLILKAPQECFCKNFALFLSSRLFAFLCALCVSVVKKPFSALSASLR